MVYFATGQSALSPEAAETLRQAAAKLRETPDLLVVIEGHADQRGEPDRNSQLSLLRAGSAAALLKQEGLESSRIQVRGVGSARPADSRNTPEAWARNRRVEVQTRVRRQ
jgi:outer membrane protein OmpA-like peptidoglycan-associated protein